MKLIIENLVFLFRYNNILFLDSYFYNINKKNLISFLRYSKILGVNIPTNFYSIDYIIDNCFEIIESNHKYAKYYYGVLVHILLHFWKSDKLFILLEKYNYYINYINYKIIMNSENKDTLILFYYIIRNLISIESNYYSGFIFL
jgi:hypothetical protein